MSTEPIECPAPPTFLDTPAGRLQLIGWTIGKGRAVYRDYPGEAGGDAYPVYRLNVRPGSYR